MKVKNRVKLKLNEREKLKQLISKGIEKARKITRCRILLMADEGESDTHIIETLDVARNTVRAIRSRYAQDDLEAAINEQGRPGAPTKFTGKEKAKITAIACSKPPHGHSRWTIRLLTDKVIELDIVDSISHMSIERILKKTNLSLT
jgi:transposase